MFTGNFHYYHIWSRTDLRLVPGVVVENFSYVFQTSAGGAKSITREEMRSFKKVWGEFANAKTGYLERPSFIRFFQVSFYKHEMGTVE